MKRIWILDGHNVIFAIPGLERLQVSGRGDEARRGLLDRLRRFAQDRGETVLVVFDGNDFGSDPDAIREPPLEVVYAPRGAGGADALILRRARKSVDQRQTVTVVTDDVRTLAGKLPDAARRLEVHFFWRKYIEPAGAPDDKRVEGDFSDVEREMAARAAADEEGARRPASAAADPGEPSANVSPGDRVRRKRERGRRRQERRLERRPDRGRRRMT